VIFNLGDIVMMIAVACAAPVIVWGSCWIEEHWFEGDDW
jgi:hypothetical protein